MYLTNNSDYSPEGSTAIADIADADHSTTNVYTLTGILLRRNVQRSQALQGLPAGIYVMDNKKIKN